MNGPVSKDEERLSIALCRLATERRRDVNVIERDIFIWLILKKNLNTL